jgi:hypothetical protein
MKNTITKVLALSFFATCGFCSEAMRSMNDRQNREPFSEKEDKKLIKFVKMYGKKWTEISMYMKNRTKWQCRYRYVNYLTPNISQRPWTPEENDRLLGAVEIVGNNNWECIGRLFFKRSTISMRNQYRLLIRRQANGESDDATTARGFNIVNDMFKTDPQQ